MKPTHAAPLAALVLAALTGCAAEVGDEEQVGVAQEAALSYNALSYNALSYNALSYNALSYNALSYNALSYNALSYNALASIQDPSSVGTLSRQLLSYTVGCALNASQSFTFSWTDANGVPQDETYAGQLGLAPQWASAPLTSRTSQQLVSACLAARTNYFGVTVPISVRGLVDVLLDNTTSTELSAYPYVEGAFWGNLFAPTPSLNSCYNPRNVSHSRADQRDCATGHPDADGQLDACGIIQLTGSCDDQCDWFDPWNQLYVGCGEGQTANALTVGLE
jgi:hypothetical protein